MWYLEHDAVTIAGLTFFGLPFSPRSASPNSAFQTNDAAAAQALQRHCPRNVDVLLAHSTGVCDGADGFPAAVARLAPW